MEYNRIFGFSGINRQVSPFLKADGEFRESQNFDTNKIGVLKKTGDYSLTASLANITDIVSGAWFREFNGGQYEHILVARGISNSIIYSEFTAQKTDLTKSETTRLAFFRSIGVMFAANKTDGVFSYRGTFSSESSSPSASLSPSSSLSPSASGSLSRSPSSSISPSASDSPSLSISPSSSRSPSASTSPSSSLSPSSSSSASKSPSSSLSPSSSTSISPSSSLSPSSSRSPSASTSPSNSSSVSLSPSSSASRSMSASISPSASEPYWGKLHLTNAPKALVPFVFGERLYLLNVVLADGTNYPYRAYRSSLSTINPLTWDTDNDWFNFDDELVGATYMGDNALFGCKNSVYMLTQNDEKLPISTNGCISNETMASYGRFAFWGSENGIYATDGGDEQKISTPVDEYWNAVTDKTIVRFGVKGSHLYVYLGTIVVGGLTLQNVLLDYNILKNDWNKISLGSALKSVYTVIDETGEELFWGGSDGKVYKMFDGGSQAGNNIYSYLETDWDYGSGPRNIDDFSELWGHGELLSAIKVSYKVNDERNNWVACNRELNGSSGVVKFFARGHKIKFLLEETSKNNLYEIHALDVGYTPSHEINIDMNRKDD